MDDSLSSELEYFSDVSESSFSPRHVYKNGKNKKPKRNKSAFIFFSSEKRLELKAKTKGQYNSNEMMVELADLWSKLTQKEKQKYYLLADEDKARYLREFNAYLKTNPECQIKNKTKNNHVKKPCSAYALFLKDRKVKIKESMPQLKMADVLKEVSKMWKELSDDEKAPYEERAKIEKELAKEKLTKQINKRQNPIYDKLEKKSAKKKQREEEEDEDKPVEKKKRGRKSTKGTKKEKIVHDTEDDDDKEVVDPIHKFLKFDSQMLPGAEEVKEKDEVRTQCGSSTASQHVVELKIYRDFLSPEDEIEDVYIPEEKNTEEKKLEVLPNYHDYHKNNDLNLDFFNFPADSNIVPTNLNMCAQSSLKWSFHDSFISCQSETNKKTTSRGFNNVLEGALKSWQDPERQNCEVGFLENWLFN